MVPGITSLQALAASHRIPLNAIGGAIQVTTGRRLREGCPRGAETVAVMLDGDCAFREPARRGLHHLLGRLPRDGRRRSSSPGRSPRSRERIVAARAEARAAHGWIMDTYLLRRR